MGQPLVHGLHHVTAIAGGAQRNLSFYADALGLRFVKRTVNFDDPGTYHLYYGDETGSAGTIMTFFPWEGATPGRVGAGQVTITQFAVPLGSLEFWRSRLPKMGAELVAREEQVFGETRAVFTDPDGLVFALVEVADDGRMPWVGADIEADVAIRGFRGVTLAVRNGAATLGILRDVFGYEDVGEVAIGTTGAKLTRLVMPGSSAGVVDIRRDPSLSQGVDGTGTVHHVAFGVADRAAQLAVRERMVAAGHRVTEQINRDYFWAIYSRTPDGILFEVATDEPGFAADEPVATLGESLRIPAQHEDLRTAIEARLPTLDR